MKHKKLFAQCGAVGVLALALASGALASGALASGGGAASAGPAVTVRVEGLSHTLLAKTTIHLHQGSLTRFGAPEGKCPDTSAAGALDEATHHHWDGKYESSFGDYEVLSILGEAHSFSSKDYWELFVNNASSSTGACETHLHAGEQLLFAAVPDKGIEYPLEISAPAHVRRGDSFTVKVDWFKGGASKPLANAVVTGAGPGVTTDSRGAARITARHVGTLVLNCRHHGYIRAVPVAVRVS